MKRKNYLTAVPILMAFFLIPSLSFGEIPVVTGLLCEYHSNPLGIDIEKPRFTWQIQTSEKGFKQTAFEIRVAGSPALPGRKNQQVWSSGKVESDRSVNVEYGGEKLDSRKRYYWQVRIWGQNQKPSAWSETAWFETAFLTPSLWKAGWIAAEGKSPDDHRPVCFRTEFGCSKKVKSARLYITAFGIYQAYINGVKVGSDLFAPGWTSYKKRTQYQVYDITPLLKMQNAIGVVVADGWYRGYIGNINKGNYYGDKCALIAQAEITYTDGSTAMVTTGPSWQAGDGPILESDIYHGEHYDATLEKPGWNQPGFKDGSFKNAVDPGYSRDMLVAWQGNPVRAVMEIKPRKMFRTPANELVLDFGQNMVGWVRMKVKGNKGDRVVLKFAEVLDREGNFYTENLRKAKVTDTYILKGGGEEIYEPAFTFHGFRYMKLDQFPGNPGLDDFTGVVIHSDMQLTGSFVCSDTLINQLQQNIQWGQRGNFLDVPTDCPQRDERLGWTGDAQVFAPTAAFNFNVAPFFTKWMLDLSADQREDGMVPNVIPDKSSGTSGGRTAWADAAVIVPWVVYLTYGDARILENQYESMNLWIKYMQGRAGEDLIWTGDYHYGDWLAFASTRSDYPGATTSKDLIATAYFAYSSELVSKIAHILGKPGDAEYYNDLAEKVKKAFSHEFVTPSGRLVSNTQTAYAVALAFDLLPSELVPKAAGYLAEDVREMKHLTTGFVGTPLLCHTLSGHGYADLAFMLLMRKEYPSWLYPVTQGATTIWERWDGQKPDGTFQATSMNSFNHYAYGAIGEWLYSFVAGIRIDPDAPGYKHFFLSPHPGADLNFAAAEMKTLYGTISSEWKRENGKMIYSCQVPPNTSATICFENCNAANVSAGDVPLLSDKSLQTSQEKGILKIRTGSGKYSFTFPAD